MMELGENNLINNDKAFIVGVLTNSISKENIDDNLDELELLAETAGVKTIGRFTQKISRISPKYFIGKGKAEQIIEKAIALKVNIIIFDDELSPTQVRNYHKLSKDIKVIDRTALILEIFTKHARTREAKTQVELARLEYLLPRLTRMWTHLERQMGGIGVRAGAGETQIEVDRRLIRNRISKLKMEINGIEKERETQSRFRRNKFRVSLVGYTNAGKSTLLNALTGADVYIKNKLFATLDTTIRSLQIGGKKEVLLSDSVGFIRKLPHGLVASFKSTLKEAIDSDLLLIVLDASSKFLNVQLQTVNEVLNSIGAHKNESLIVINKIDLLERSELIAIQERFKEAIFISAKNKLMIDNVFDNIKTKIESSYQTAVVTFSASSGKEIASVFDHVEVIEQNYEPNIVKLKIRGQRSMIRKILKLSRNG
ncbi:MAG: GTPase HflX [Candidatus Marinimicrobia bacterium]|nr:GTPase HflX [Candidatus Neomarinimicrobiota bacterium]|tara:strand:+ start:7065 stop:8342 length:1278 start_codon:yes stop_codon:yes gene_type:complete